MKRKLSDLSRDGGELRPIPKWCRGTNGSCKADKNVCPTGWASYPTLAAIIVTSSAGLVMPTNLRRSQRT